MDSDMVLKIILEIVNENMDMLGLVGVDKNTPLFGEFSEIDSIQLITLTGRIEDHFCENYDVDFTIVTEDTFSREPIPFSSIENLAAYLFEIIVNSEES